MQLRTFLSALCAVALAPILCRAGVLLERWRRKAVIESVGGIEVSRTVHGLHMALRGNWRLRAPEGVSLLEMDPHRGLLLVAGWTPDELLQLAESAPAPGTPMLYVEDGCERMEGPIAITMHAPHVNFSDLYFCGSTDGHSSPLWSL